MNTITQLRKSFRSGMLLGLLTMVCPFLVQAQQPTVTVPDNCEVVVAGTGGTLGFGGTVGNGGVVVMPDPFDIDPMNNGDKFNIVENSTTLINWRLWGDLSFDTYPNFENYISATTTPTAIYSYNKLKRDSETQELARSKGRMRVSYITGICNSYIEFDVFKKYSGPLPDIVGPADCWLPNTTYTYSVDQIASDNLGDAIGVDDYYWTIYRNNVAQPQNLLYHSADKSSITFTTPGDVSGDWYIECCYGKANTTSWGGGTSTTCVTKPIGLEPEEPEFTLAPPICLNTGVTSFNVTLDSLSILSGATYTWSASGTSWTLSQNGSSNQNLTVTGVDNNPGTLVLTIDNGTCSSAVFTYDVKRNFTAPLAISGTNCVSAGDIHTYSLPANALLNETEWVLPNTEWVITEQNNTGSSVKMQVPLGTPGGTYTLTAKSVDCSGTISRTINVRPATPVFTSSTPGCVIQGITGLTTIAVDTSVFGTPTTGYEWNLSDAPGWTISSGEGTSNPTFNVPVPTPNMYGGFDPVTISVTLKGGSNCHSLTATKEISYIAIQTSFPPVGCDQYILNSCLDGTPVWYINNSPAASYPGAIIYDNILILCGSGTPPTSVCANVVIDSVTHIVCADTIGTKGKIMSSGTYEEDNSVKIYPNPNKGTFSIYLDGFNTKSNVQILDVQGRLINTHILQKGENTLTEKVPTGTYLLLINVDGKMSAQKIQINN